MDWWMDCATTGNICSVLWQSKTDIPTATEDEVQILIHLPNTLRYNYTYFYQNFPPLCAVEHNCLQGIMKKPHMVKLYYKFSSGQLHLFLWFLFFLVWEGKWWPEKQQLEWRQHIYKNHRWMFLNSIKVLLFSVRVQEGKKRHTQVFHNTIFYL